MPRDTLAHLTPDGDLVAGTVPGASRLWPFTQSRRLLWRSRRPARLDPINLFVLRTPPEAVIATLGGQGWCRPGDGATHRTWVNGTFRLMVDHIALGDRAERTHVRAFAFADGALLAAHHEVANARGRHIVSSWDAARATTAAALEAAGYTRIAPTAMITPPDLRGVSSDGRVWRLVGP